MMLKTREYFDLVTSSVLDLVSQINGNNMLASKIFMIFPIISTTFVVNMMMHKLD